MKDLTIVLIAALSLASWITNLIWTFKQDAVANVLLGITGIILAPIGSIHGIYTWF